VIKTPFFGDIFGSNTEVNLLQSFILSEILKNLHLFQRKIRALIWIKRELLKEKKT